MTLLVLFILAVIWLAVLLPPYFQNRSESRPADSISSFQRQLSVLERRSATGTPAPGSRVVASPITASSRVATSAVESGAGPHMTRFEARRRRRDVLLTLAAAAMLTFPLAAILGGPVWGLQILCDVLLVAYVVLLLQVQQRSSERQAKVRYLGGTEARAPEPALLLRRSGS